LVPIIPAYRLPTPPTLPMRRPIKGWGGRAGCLHRPPAKGPQSTMRSLYVLLGGAPPHPRRGPAHRRQRRQAAGVAAEGLTSCDHACCGIVTLMLTRIVCPNCGHLGARRVKSSRHRALWVRPMPRRFLDAMDASRVRHRTMLSGYLRNPSPCLATWPMPGQAK
jgi:hypothetical protein